MNCKDMRVEVVDIRYFQTRRGLGYECKTNIEGVSIWNDGLGGGTYLHTYKNDFMKFTEDELEDLINQYEFNKLDNNRND